MGLFDMMGPCEAYVNHVIKEDENIAFAPS